MAVNGRGKVIRYGRTGKRTAQSHVQSNNEQSNLNFGREFSRLGFRRFLRIEVVLGDGQLEMEMIGIKIEYGLPYDESSGCFNVPPLTERIFWNWRYWKIEVSTRVDADAGGGGR